jgi:hypothetical protein
MKSIIKLFILCSVILLFLFLWREIPDLSLSKKINPEKVSSFFTAMGSLLTAVTVFLLYKQIKEQIEDRRASSKPDLYPTDQFFNSRHDKIMPRLTRDKKDEALSGLISIHNIGLGTAKEIIVRWRFNKDLLGKLVDGGLKDFYMSEEPEDFFSFVSANSQLDTQLPLIYMASFSSFEPGWTLTIWEELYLEISYKDIHDFQYSTKIFKATVYVDLNFVRFEFKRADFVNLSSESTIRSPLFEK